MHERIDNADERVKRLERIVRDNDIGTRLVINTRQKGSSLKRLALESIKGIGRKEAIEGLKRLMTFSEVDRELKTYASQLLEILVSHNKNKR